MFETVKSAQEALAGKLVFGDAKQIQAVRFLEAVESAKSAILSCEKRHASPFVCRNCNGTGACKYLECSDEHECRECDGTGSTILGCSCMSIFSYIVAVAAAKSLDEERRENVKAA